VNFESFKKTDLDVPNFFWQKSKFDLSQLNWSFEYSNLPSICRYKNLKEMAHIFKPQAPIFKGAN
jgi:hypothetical protein